MKTDLTPVEAALLAVIIDHERRQTQWTIRGLAVAIGCSPKSVNHIFTMLRNLEAKGHLAKSTRLARVETLCSTGTVHAPASERAA